MTSSNVARARQYLQIVAFENVADFYSPDVVIQEFPNRIAPQGRVRRAADLRAAHEQSRKILRSQTYRVQRILDTGDEVAVELEWSGILDVPVMNLPAGSEMKAFVAMFLTFQEGKIVSQRNYDCYPPFDPQPSPAIPALVITTNTIIAIQAQLRETSRGGESAPNTLRHPTANLAS